MILSVDPGIGGTGWAAWEEKDFAKRLRCPVACGNLYAHSSANGMVEKSFSILDKLEPIFERYSVKMLISEEPEFFDSAGGHMTAVTGDLIKLTFFVGTLAGLCHSLDIDFSSVPPSEWKGQTSKEQVIRKLLHILPDLDRKLRPKSHSYDAIGIGLWVQKFYDRNANQA